MSQLTEEQLRLLNEMTNQISNIDNQPDIQKNAALSEATYTADNLVAQPREISRKDTFGSMNKEAFLQGKKTFMYNGRLIATWDPVTGKAISTEHEQARNDKQAYQENTKKEIEEKKVETYSKIPEATSLLNNFNNIENTNFTNWKKESQPIMNNLQPIKQDLKKQSLEMFYNKGKELGYSDADIRLAMDKRNMYLDKYKNLRNKISVIMGDWGKGWQIH